MARTFTATSYLEINSAVISGPPATVMLRFNAANITQLFPLFYIGDKDVANVYWLGYADGATSGDPLTMQIRNAGVSPGASDFRLTPTANGYSATTWHSAAFVYAASNDLRIYLDANDGSKGSETAGVTAPAGMDRTSIGRFGDSTPGAQPADCIIAEACVWNAALELGEIQAYADGASPLLIRAKSIVAYWPIVGRTSPEKDLFGWGDITLTGTAAQTAHPPMRYPGRVQAWKAPAGGGGGFQAAWARNANTVLVGGRLAA